MSLFQTLYETHSTEKAQLNALPKFFICVLLNFQ